MNAAMLGPLVAAVLVAAIARHHQLSAPLVLVITGLLVGLIPAVPEITLRPDLVLFVILPPLLWSAGLESSFISMRRNKRPILLLAVGLPMATTVAVGAVAYFTVPAMTPAAALTLGAVVAPPDAVAATAIGRRLGLPRRIMTLLSGESLLNDATALTLYKVALAAAIGAATGWGMGLATFAMAAVGGAVTGVVFGSLIVIIRARLSDPLVESAVGLVAPFVIYLVAEEIHGSGVLAVVVAALMLGQRFTRAHHATRLQDQAVWRALQFLLESLAFLLIGLQLPTVVQDMRGVRFSTLTLASLAVFGTVLVVRAVWMVVFAYAPRSLSAKIRQGEPAPTHGQVLVLSWAGMRGVVSLAAAFGVPLTTLSGEPFPGRPQLVFLTFVVVIGTLLLHGLTLPWMIRRLGVQSEQARADALASANAQDKAARAAANRLDELLASTEPSPASERAAEALRGWNTRRRNAARERLRRFDPGAESNSDETAAAAFRRLRLEMLIAERAALITERDQGRIDDQVLRALMYRLDLEEAALNVD
ncbi:Na+/H+ antiporter [Mycolicibacter arupensis]|uniref:Na+/H+ antiporter n=2 Tax=Mycolicibacter arupensis TaxID=342002 RepID=A0A0F5MSF7_9MYCO|nr:Na+/H+ antiporter [Mycolicibacter arupensis]KKB97544.1 sodium:proton exchanger [Mycolicibacter arupensis]MCV7276596.1 Na+/H+ antiporter [Mycolicibacter arupensis]OQZ94143.1 Na+/H+ antiporter [Mycolicibacter arupensis]